MAPAQHEPDPDSRNTTVSPLTVASLLFLVVLHCAGSGSHFPVPSATFFLSAVRDSFQHNPVAAQSQ